MSWRPPEGVPGGDANHAQEPGSLGARQAGNKAGCAAVHPEGERSASGVGAGGCGSGPGR